MTEITATELSILQKTELLLTEFETRKKQRDKSCSHIGIDAYLLAKESGDKDSIIKTATSLTHYYTDITSEFDKAVYYLKDIIELLDNEADAENKAEFCRRLGLNYDFLGELVASKKAYDMAIQILEDKTNLGEKEFLVLARSLFNESIIYGRLGLNTLSKDYLYRAYEYFMKANYEPGIVRCYISFGVEAYDLKDFQKSLEFYQKAIVLSEETSDIPPYCISLGNCGIVYAESGDSTNAIDCISKAIDKVKNQTNKHFELSIYHLAGRIYQILKDYTLADQWFSEADRLHKEVGKALDNSDLYKYWSETLHELGKHKEAYEKLSVFIKHQEEIHSLNKQAEISDAMLRFKYEEGKKEQELLKKKNNEIEEYTHQLEMSNYELNQFAHVASHDMKEPLRMISNYTQLLDKSLNGQLTIDQKDYLYYINDGAKRMMSVIQSLLQLSKINSTLKKEMVDLNEVLNEVKLTLQLDIIEKNVKLESVELPHICADRIHIIQLIQNFVGNAIKYNESEQPEVKILHEDRDTYNYFEISDNGIGISPEHREKVFILFQRLHDRHKYDGTGIGLAICKKIIDSLHGRIWIEESISGGCKFCFTIPK